MKNNFTFITISPRRGPLRTKAICFLYTVENQGGSKPFSKAWYPARMSAVYKLVQLGLNTTIEDTMEVSRRKGLEYRTFSGGLPSDNDDLEPGKLH